MATTSESESERNPITTEQKFKVDAERIKGKIRDEELGHLRLDLKKAKVVTKIKTVQVNIAKENLKGVKVELKIAEEQTRQKQLKLTGEKTESSIIEAENNIKSDQLGFSQKARQIGKEIIAAKLQSQRTTLGELQGNDSNRRSELRTKGVVLKFPSSDDKTTDSARAIGG